jgi:formylglycine-generating enzyme
LSGLPDISLGALSKTVCFEELPRYHRPVTFLELPDIKARNLFFVLAMSPSLAACTPTPAQVTPVDIPAVSVSASANPTEPTEGPTNMAYLRGGTLKTASSDEVTSVASFWLDKTEATAWDYRNCVRAGKCSEKDIVCDEYATYGSPKKDHPINCVDHGQATAYCAFVGKRLPTMAEWEWAARGGSQGTKHPWGGAELSDQLCWKRFHHSTGKGEGTCPVKSFSAGNTPSGIADLEGNVSEWTSTLNPNFDTLAIIRGHTWADFDPAAISIDPQSQGVARNLHVSGLGFRCALSVDFTNKP